MVESGSAAPHRETQFPFLLSPFDFLLTDPIMPEQDFELYLSLLSRFLRLKPTQHAEIADELRDHLEERLAELTTRGLSHDEAIRKALDEFGDAAELAQHFTRASHIRRRRLIMRCTLGTIGTVAAAMLVATAFWPEAAQSPIPARSIAKDTAVAERPEAEMELAAATDKGRAQAEAKMKKRLDSLTLVDMPLEDVVEYFAEQTGLDILIDKPSLSDEGVQLDSPVTFRISRNPIEAGLALKLILEPLTLGYMYRDNVVVIATSAKMGEKLEIRVYNVRDLLADHDLGVSLTTVGGQGGGFFSVYSLLPAIVGKSKAPAEDEKAAATATATPAVVVPQIPKPVTLADVVTRCVVPESWDAVGGPGTVTQYNGMLVVNQTEEVHSKVAELLELMRQSTQEKKPRKNSVPKGETQGN